MEAGGLWAPPWGESRVSQPKHQALSFCHPGVRGCPLQGCRPGVRRQTRHAPRGWAVDGYLQSDGPQNLQNGITDLQRDTETWCHTSRALQLLVSGLSNCLGLAPDSKPPHPNLCPPIWQNMQGSGGQPVCTEGCGSGVRSGPAFLFPLAT